MLNGKRILAVIPARGGSKGVPLKNIHPVQGIPLIAYIAPIIKVLPQIDRTVVSTDHPEIARVAKKAGLEVPFMRPPELSGDQIADWDVLVHALETMEKLDKTTYDVILLLPPTSPLRRPDHVEMVLEKIIQENFDSAWTVSEMDLKFHPLKALTLEDGALHYFDPRGSQIIARQQLKKTYFRNGLAYGFTKECLLNQKKILGARAGAVVTQGPVVNIDTLEDFQRLEKILQEKPHTHSCS